MGTEWTTLSQGVVPLDGTGLTTAVPREGAAVRLTLSGELSLPEAGITVDAAEADTPTSLIQIDPGQWHMVDTRPNHGYVFVPTVPLHQAPVVRLDLQAVEKQFGFAKQETPTALTGKISVELSTLAPEAPFPFLEAALGAALLALLVAAVVVHRRRVRRGDDTDIEGLLDEIRSLAHALDKKTKERSNAVPRAIRDIDVLISSAERLCASTQVLRRQLRRRGVDPLQAATPTDATEDGEESVTDGATAVGERAILQSLVAEEQRLREKLERIRDALSGLLDAWTAVDTAREEESGDAEAKLEEAQAEVTAVLVNKAGSGGSNK